MSSVGSMNQRSFSPSQLRPYSALQSPICLEGDEFRKELSMRFSRFAHHGCIR